MAKAYWVTFYRSVRDEAALARYAKLAGPAIESQGGRILARGKPSQCYEAGLAQRVVVIEYENLQAAKTAYESPQYQAALANLAGTVERDLRIVEGL